MADGENIVLAAVVTEEGAIPAVEEAQEAFDAPVRVAVPEDDAVDALIVNLDGYEGPLDVLLDLARHQKVDIRKISMVALVDQYLRFVEVAKERNLELAADYLVMASWLAFLKSKMLLPIVESDDDEPTADEMAARLAFQLQRLEAMRKVVEDLQALPQKGEDFFPRGAPEGVRVTHKPDWQADLYDLLRAYAVQRVAAVDREYHLDPPAVYSVEAARIRLERILGAIPEWTELRSLTTTYDVEAPDVSVLASSFNAALEFAKAGKIDLRQLGTFEPIYIKARQSTDEGDAS
ncbi:ScpA family protein [Hyphococcus formosus]|uniref:segregation and condensation protein A n=1 Tax=Hyphococcus formosus TaxID=3143534 RepID=UPI00398AAD86